MKKNIYGVLVSLIAFTSYAQPAPRLIVRGDDMGFSHSGNAALIKAYQEGIETSIEVIVPSPWFPEAVKLLKQNPGVDVGIHLALTSEWDNIKWKPLTNGASIKDANGYFFPMVYANKNYPGQSLKENKWTIEDIEKEFRAQLELGLKLLPQISHISSHMGCTDLSEDVKQLTLRLAHEYHIGTGDGLTTASLSGQPKTPEGFITMLTKLDPGKTYVFVEHPGLDNEELRAVSHSGYENVAEDRQRVTAMFTSEQVKAVIKQRGIQLIGYKEFLQQKK
jgi:predicted glycoside hydrolase/deacetylase ChbG (UPF0249 family)